MKFQCYFSKDFLSVQWGGISFAGASPTIRSDVTEDARRIFNYFIRDISISFTAAYTFFLPPLLLVRGTYRKHFVSARGVGNFQKFFIQNLILFRFLVRYSKSSYICVRYCYVIVHRMFTCNYRSCMIIIVRLLTLHGTKFLHTKWRLAAFKSGQRTYPNTASS